MNGNEGLVQIMQAMGISPREQQMVIGADGPDGMLVRRVEDLIRSGEFNMTLMKARMSGTASPGNAMRAVMTELVRFSARLGQTCA